MRKIIALLTIGTLLTVTGVSAMAQSEPPYTPRWRLETVYPKNFNTWSTFHIGYHGSDSTGCGAPYYRYADVENQACRILDWDSAPNAEGVYFARIRTSTGCIVRWPWKWHTSPTGPIWYFLGRTP